MASTPVEFFSPSGLTLTQDLYPFGSDTRAATHSATEKTNRKGLYSATVTEAITGWHTMHVLAGSVVIGTYAVYLLDTTAIFRAGDLIGLTDGAIKSETFTVGTYTGRPTTLIEMLVNVCKRFLNKSTAPTTPTARPQAATFFDDDGTSTMSTEPWSASAGTDTKGPSA